MNTRNMPIADLENHFKNATESIRRSLESMDEICPVWGSWVREWTAPLIDSLGVQNPCMAAASAMALCGLLNFLRARTTDLEELCAAVLSAESLPPQAGHEIMRTLLERGSATGNLLEALAPLKP